MILTLAVGGVGGALFIAAWLLLNQVLGRTPVQRRLEALRQFSTDRRSAARRFGDDVLTALLRVAGAFAGGAARQQRTQALLDRAAVPSDPSRWVLVRVAAGFLVFLVVVLLLPWYVAAPCGVVLGWTAPDAALRIRVERRRQAFAAHLPETLQLAVSSLRAGFTLQHALEAAANDGDGPVAEELRRALSETRLGGDLEDALDRMAARTGNRDVRWLVMAIRIHREVGGNLSEVLQTTTDTMRERAQLHRQVRTLAAEGRLSGFILFGLPVVIGLWLLVFRRGYIRPLYTEPIGLAMLAYAALSLVAGAFWLRAVVRIDT